MTGALFCVFTYLRIYINTYLHIYIFTYLYFGISIILLIFAMPNHCSVLHRPSTGQMLNTKLGYFYVHRSTISWVFTKWYLIRNLQMLLYAINAFGCLSRILFAQRVNTMMIWRSREMAAVLASIRVQENLPKIAKSSQYVTSKSRAELISVISPKYMAEQ